MMLMSKRLCRCWGWKRKNTIYHPSCQEASSQDVLSLLKVSSEKFGQTVVMITHNEEIAQLADRIVRIEDGYILSENHAEGGEHHA